MKWYKVTKKINGRLYDYWQKTYRVGKSVKTLNKYIGPTRTLLRGQPIPGWRTMTSAERYNVKKDRIFHDAEILNRQYDALREAETHSPSPATAFKPVMLPKHERTHEGKGPATCTHSRVVSPDANPSRGWHSAHCRLCGIDMSYDSSD
jgi:hypothetical protein